MHFMAGTESDAIFPDVEKHWINWQVLLYCQWSTAGTESNAEYLRGTVFFGNKGKVGSEIPLT